MKVKHVAGALGAGAALGLFLSFTSPSPAVVTVRGVQVTALQNAAEYAAQCGGGVEVSDQDIVVVSCDK